MNFRAKILFLKYLHFGRKRGLIWIGRLGRIVILLGLFHQSLLEAEKIDLIYSTQHFNFITRNLSSEKSRDFFTSFYDRIFEIPKFLTLLHWLKLVYDRKCRLAKPGPTSGLPKKISKIQFSIFEVIYNILQLLKVVCHKLSQAVTSCHKLVQTVTSCQKIHLNLQISCPGMLNNKNFIELKMFFKSPKLTVEFTLLNEIDELELGELELGDCWRCWWVATLALLDLGEFWNSNWRQIRNVIF